MQLINISIFPYFLPAKYSISQYSNLKESYHNLDGHESQWPEYRS